MSSVASRIKHGLYGGKEQFYITGVDGTCAQLGGVRPSDKELEEIIPAREKAHNRYVRRIWRERKYPKPVPIVPITNFKS